MTADQQRAVLTVCLMAAFADGDLSKLLAAVKS
jgi:hypothetical protein